MLEVIADVREMNSASILDLIVIMIISSNSIIEFFNNLGQAFSSKDKNILFLWNMSKLRCSHQV